jgi:hypothetical protein
MSKVKLGQGSRMPERSFPVVYAVDVERCARFIRRSGFREHVRFAGGSEPGHVGLRRGPTERDWWRCVGNSRTREPVNCRAGVRRGDYAGVHSPRTPSRSGQPLLETLMGVCAGSSRPVHRRTQALGLGSLIVAL